MRLIKKIKRDAKGKMTFGYVETIEDGLSSEHVAKYTEQPHPDFLIAFEAVSSHIAPMLEMPADAVERLKASEVDLSYDDIDECKAVTISATFYIPKQATAVGIKTPTFNVPKSDKEEGLPGYLTKQEMADIGKLLQEADRYINGHRAQGNLFEDGEQESDGDDKAVTVVPSGIPA